MSDTVRSLAQSYHVSIEKAVEALEKNGTIILSVDMPIVDDDKLEKYKQIISRLAIPAPDPKQKPKPKPISMAELGRDYVIFTHMALRKPATAEILRQVILIQSKNKTNTKIVLCKEAVDQVVKAAQSDSRLKEMVNSLTVLDRYNMLTILSGRISEENRSISLFIKSKNVSDSILIVGFNRSLDSFIFSRNRRNASNKKYVKIIQADVTNGGVLVVPDQRRPAFANAERKQRSDLGTTPSILKGRIPTIGDNAYYYQNGSLVPVVLESELGAGGEAITYKIFQGTKCAKIFKAQSNCPMKMKKISLMCGRRSHMESIDAPIMERIAWPEKMLYNTEGEAIGYIMKLFQGTHCLSEFAYDTFEEIIPNVQKSHQITMAVSLAELIDFLHHNNIILCDINKENIMFDSNQAAYIIDLDSAQIADKNCYYPSNVGIPEFLSPEHVYDNNFSFLHKKADDIWILQMLLFQILTPMGNPYAGSCTNEKEAVSKGLYPYQAGDKAADTEIKGTPWHMIVSHFPRFLKMMFWNSFHGSGKFFHEADRRLAQAWLNTMVEYQEILPEHVKGDGESGKFMPTRYRKYVQSSKKGDELSLDELLKRLSQSGSKNVGWEDID